jgi:hypothetical protein
MIKNLNLLGLAFCRKMNFEKFRIEIKWEIKNGSSFGKEDFDWLQGLATGYADSRRLFLLVVLLDPHTPNRSGFRLVRVERLGGAGDVGAGSGFLSVWLSFLRPGSRPRSSPLSIGGVGTGFKNFRFLHTTAPESSLIKYERFRFFSWMVPVEDHFFEIGSWTATRWPTGSSGNRSAFWVAI